MKKALSVPAFILLLLALAACGTAGKIHNQKDSAGWAGTYSGTIPAADGPGIDVRITLYTDFRYELVYKYIGKNNDALVYLGDFRWDKKKNMITLNNNRGIPPYYNVGENILTQLDLDKRAIKGEHADMYILRKKQ